MTSLNVVFIAQRRRNGTNWQHRVSYLFFFRNLCLDRDCTKSYGRVVETGDRFCKKVKIILCKRWPAQHTARYFMKLVTKSIAQFNPAIQLSSVEGFWNISVHVASASERRKEIRSKLNNLRKHFVWMCLVWIIHMSGTYLERKHSSQYHVKHLRMGANSIFSFVYLWLSQCQRNKTFFLTKAEIVFTRRFPQINNHWKIVSCHAEKSD